MSPETYQLAEKVIAAPTVKSSAPPASKEVEAAIYNIYNQVEAEDAGFVHDINVLVSAVRHAPESVNLPDIGTETLEKHPSYKVKTFKSGGEIVMEIPDQNDPNSSMVCLLSDTPTQLLAQQQTIDELKVHILSASAPESVNRELMDLIKQQVKREKVSMHLSDCGCLVCQMEVAISRASTAVASEDTRDKTIAELEKNIEAADAARITAEVKLREKESALARKTAERDAIDAEHRDCGKKLFDLQERFAGTEKTYCMQSECVKEMEKELSAVNATLAKLTDEMEGDVRTAIESVPGIDALHVNTRGQICRAVLRVYRAARSAAERNNVPPSTPQGSVTPINGPGADSSSGNLADGPAASGSMVSVPPGPSLGVYGKDWAMFNWNHIIITASRLSTHFKYGAWAEWYLRSGTIKEYVAQNNRQLPESEAIAFLVEHPLTSRPRDNGQSAMGVTPMGQCTCGGVQYHSDKCGIWGGRGKLVGSIPTIADSSEAMKSPGPTGAQNDIAALAAQIAELRKQVQALQAKGTA